MKKNADYEDDLKRSGLKNTKHRTAVLDILEHNNQPITAEQVFLELKGKDISINMSTVYRTLEILADKNLVTKLHLVSDSKALFEYNRMIHRHYLFCLGCKKFLAIDHCPLEEYEKSLEKDTDFTICGHKLDIYGYCPECSKRNRQE